MMKAPLPTSTNLPLFQFGRLVTCLGRSPGLLLSYSGLLPVHDLDIDEAGEEDRLMSELMWVFLNALLKI